MNAIKNTIVSVTLLAVAFGAYTVLQNPPQHSLDDNELTWDATADLMDPDVPESSLPSTETLATNTNSHQQFLDRIGAPRSDAGAAELSSDNLVDDSAGGQLPAYQDPPLEDSNQGDGAYLDGQYVDDSMPAEDPSSTAATSALTSFGHSADLVQDPNGQGGAPSANDGYYDQIASDSSPHDDGAGVVDLSPPGDDGESGQSAGEFDNAMNYVEVQLQQEQLGEALLTLSQSYQAGLSSEQYQRVGSLMDQLAGTVIYSTKSYIQPVHEVRENETLESIAASFQLPVDFLARVNGLEATYEPVVGESLKVLQGPFRAVINASSGDLTLFLGDYYAGRFLVQLGDDVPRSSGEFEVIEKSDGREFFDRSSGYRVAKDDPANPYGHRWIGLRGEQVTAGHNVGIHVANENAPNAGCFRVSPVDADDLSAILSVGSRVTLVR